MRQPVNRIACIGEAMIELGFPESRTQASVGFAGDTLNTAIYLTRCLAKSKAGTDSEPGPEVAYSTALGDDPFSCDLKIFIEDQGLSSDMIQILPGRMPGLYSITTDSGGERSFHYWRENSAARDLFGDSRMSVQQALEQCRLIYFSGITLAILRDEDREPFLDWIEHYRSLPDRSVAFDSNYRPRLWSSRESARQSIHRAWSLTDIALPSLDDEMALFGDTSAESVIERMHNLGIHQGALKRGSEGPLSLGTVSTQSYDPATFVVDTTAAGDSFNGAYLASLLNNGNQELAMKAGHQCALQVIGVSGAIVPKDRWIQP